MEIPNTTQQSGDTSHVNCHCVQFIVQKNPKTRQNLCYVWWNIYPHKILTITCISGLENIQEENYSHHYYNLHLQYKTMMVMKMKMNTSMWNNIYNLMSTMKWKNQSA